jgi:hypothetical protein
MSLIFQHFCVAGADEQVAQTMVFFYPLTLARVKGKGLQNGQVAGQISPRRRMAVPRGMNVRLRCDHSLQGLGGIHRADMASGVKRGVNLG